jgi:hypothetical protein
MNGQDADVVQSGSLRRLIRFLIELAQRRAYANVRLVIQRGQIVFVHVDRTYRLDSLPLAGEDTDGEKVNPPS